MIDRQHTINVAHHIPGWMFPREIGVLWDLLAGSMHHVEIGSFCGKSLFTAACAVPDGASVTGIDAMYEFQTPGLAWQRDVLAATVAAARHMRPKVRVTTVCGHSPDAMRNQRGLSSVFIDGDHRYEEVLADIGVSYPRILSGGLIIIHDYWDADPGVVAAVEEWFGSRSLQVERAPQTRLCWHRKSTAEDRSAASPQ